MSRIRSIKPEWLEDEQLALASSDARVLSIGLILLADDYGNGRAAPVVLSGRVFPGKSPGVLANALEELARIRFILLYETGGQRYFSIRNWQKHQRVDKPGKPQVPAPCEPYSGTLAKVPVIPENIPGTPVEIPVSPGTDSIRKGEEGKGEEGSGSTRAHADDKLSVEATSRPNRLDAVLSELARTPSEREQAIQTAESLLTREFAKRFEAAEGSLWTRAGDPAVATLAAWACSVPGGAEPAVRRLLDGFFADAWCKSQHFDIRHLARHPQKYFDPRQAPKAAPQVDPETRLAQLRAKVSLLDAELNEARSAGDKQREAGVQERLKPLLAEMRALKNREN